MNRRGTLGPERDKGSLEHSKTLPKNGDDLESWNPMVTDFKNPDVNSYDSGPGALLKPSRELCGNVYTLFVGNIPSSMEKEGLRKLFSRAGKVVTVFLSKPDENKPTLFGFVSYKTIQEAERAIELFHNYELGRGVRLSVKVKEKKEDKEKRQAQATSDRAFYNTLNCAKENSDEEEEEEKDGGIALGHGVSPRPGMTGDWVNVLTSERMQKQADMTPNEQAKRGTPTTRVSHIDGTTPSTRSLCVVCKEPCKSKCSLCGVPYCSRPCQEQDWPNHRNKCGKHIATPSPPSTSDQLQASGETHLDIAQRTTESSGAVGDDDDEYDVSVPDELIDALAHDQDGNPSSAMGDSAPAVHSHTPPLVQGSSIQHTPVAMNSIHSSAVGTCTSVDSSLSASFQHSVNTTPISSFSPGIHQSPISSLVVPSGYLQESAPSPSSEDVVVLNRSVTLSTPRVGVSSIGTSSVGSVAFNPAVMSSVKSVLYSFSILSSVPLNAPLPKAFRALATTVVSPVSFCAVVLCVETKELLKQLDTLIMEGPAIEVDADELTVGTRCGCRTKEGVVLRVKVTEYDQDRVKLLSYDFGGHLESQVANLIMLPEALLTAPSLMVTCTLSSQGEDSLGTSSADKLKELVLGKVLKISWNPVILADSSSRNIRCKFEIQDMVVGTVPGGVQPPAPFQIAPYEAPPKVSMAANTLRITNPAGKVCFHQPPRMGTFVICPHVVCSPSSMWILVQHPGTVHFKRLQEDLNSDYKNTENDCYVPQQGEICAVLRKEDQLFYRAEVKCVNNDGSFDIQYIDFGNCETVVLNQLRHLKQIFLTLPRQALKAALTAIAPISPTNMWSVDCVLHLRKKMIGRHLVAEIVAESKGTYYLSVQDPDSSAPERFIQNGLVGLGFAKYIQGHFEGDGVYMSQVPCLPPVMMEVLVEHDRTPPAPSMSRPVTPAPGLRKTSSSVAPAIRTSSSHGEENRSHVEAAEQTDRRSLSLSSLIHGTAMAINPKVLHKRKLQAIVPALDKVLNVQATYVETPHAFWMQMADPQSKKKLNDLTTAMNKTKPAVITNPVAGSLCLARSCVDGVLHRGQIASVNSNGYIKVQFLDYGNKEEVVASEAYEVENPAFLELPAQAMFCTLNNLLNPGGKEAGWDPKTLEAFESMMPLEVQLKMKVVKTFGLKHVVDVMVPSESGETDLLTLFCWRGLGTMSSGGSPQRSEGFAAMRNKEKKMNKDCGRPKEDIRKQPIENISGSDEDPVINKLSQGVGVKRENEPPLPMVRPAVPVATGSPTSVPLSSSPFSDDQRVLTTSVVHEKPCVSLKASSLPVIGIFKDDNFTLVTVATVDTPHSFYIHAVTQSSIDELNWLSVHLSTIAPSSQLLKSSVTKGDLCCAKFSKDGCWYRAEVKEVTDAHCVVQFLDYGNTDSVVWSDIVCCPVECTSVPIQAVRCALYGVIPQDLKWSPTSAEAMQKLTVDRPLMGLAHGQLPDGTFHIDLIDTYGEKDINIASELISAGFAKRPEPNIHPSQVASVIQSNHTAPLSSTRLNTKASSLGVVTNVEEFTLITVTAVDTPSCFYIQFVTQSSIDQLALIGTQLQVVVPSSQLPKSSVTKGDLCCAKFSKDGSWYRAEVKEVMDAHCVVQFLDYGNTDSVVWSDIMYCPVECTSVPVQAVRCALYGVTPRGSKWSPAATEAMQKLTLDKPMLGHTCGKLPDGTFHIDLIDTSGEKDMNVASELVLLGVASFTESTPVCPTKPLSMEVVSKQPHQLAPLVAKPILKASNLGMAAVLLSEEFSLITVTCVDTPHCIYLQAVTPSSIEKLTHLSTQLQMLLSTSPSQLAKSSVSKGDLCCAKFSKDGSWYRAEVKEVMDAHCVVQFLDYGNTDSVVWSDIMYCPVECTSVPVQAMRCALYGIIPLGSKWSSSSAEALKELTVDKVLHARLCGPQSTEGPLQVELVNTSDGTDTNIATELISLGLAGSSLHPLSSAVLPAASSAPSIPTPYLPTDAFQLYVSDVSSPSSFHIHNHDIGTLSQLRSLMEQLQSTYANPSPYSAFSPSPGASCCALFTDGAFYRCRVVKVDSVGVTLNYVDYGNNHVVPASSVFRLDPKFASFPAAAIHCSLVDMCPTQKDQWTHNVIKAFKSLVIPDKDDNTYLKGKIVARDTTPVKVQLFLDGGQRSVADILVEQNLAISTNSLVPPGTLFSLVPPTVSESELRVAVSHIECPTKLYLNPLGTKYATVAADLQNSISTYCTQAAVFTTPPKVGSLAIGQYKDGNWFRVRVLQELKTDKFEVQFVDYGDKDLLSLNQLKHFSDQFLSIPEQIFQCALYGITAKNVLVTSPALERAIGTLLSEEEYVCHVVCQCPPIVDLAPANKKRGPTIHSQLVNQKLVPPSTLLRLPRAAISAHSSSSSTVLPTVVTSPSEFWVQVVDEDVAQKLAVMMERLNQFCNSRPHASASSPLVLGQLCCAMFSEDRSWYRARIVDFRSETELKVVFVDFGNSEWTSMEHIQELREDFACLPEAAVHCCLVGYESKAACHGDITRLFKSLVEYKKLVAIKKGDIGIYQTVVELVDTSSDKDVYIHQIICSPSA